MSNAWKSRFTNVGRWLQRRAQERSTYVGIAAALGSLGYGVWGERIDHLGQILTLIGLVTGTGLAAATTTPHLSPAPEATPKE